VRAYMRACVRACVTVKIRTPRFVISVVFFDSKPSLNFKINPEKCIFFSESVKYLGHIISAENITDPEKISAVKD